MSIVLAILALSFLVFFHELGHFLAAKFFHVGVNEFSIGMGPRLLSFLYKNTRYSLKLLPLGGSCAMLGEDLYFALRQSLSSKAFPYEGLRSDKAGEVYNDLRTAIAYAQAEYDWDHRTGCPF